MVRDGLVVDFQGAIHLLRELKQQVEARLGFELSSAATTYPPGVPLAEIRATRYVVEAAGFECERMIDEPTAANAVLQIKDGAVVDRLYLVGGAACFTGIGQVIEEVTGLQTMVPAQPLFVTPLGVAMYDT